MDNCYYYDIETDKRKGCGTMIGGIIGLLICLIIALCTSCSRKTTGITDDKYVSIDKVTYTTLVDSLEAQHRTIVSLLEEHSKYDSVYVSRSDTTIIYINGDTVRITNKVKEKEYHSNKEFLSTIQSLQDSIGMLKVESNLYKQKMDSVANIKHTEVITKEVRPWYAYPLIVLSAVLLFLLSFVFIKCKVNIFSWF